ncbi:GNAT family N-acetyltransferase [Halobacteriovorax sp. JY17]|uniref:GNAT family N-acetyltransferase n=1 Tax=Halobacteriovorax sp. JY17 TaxID=2014617 RepID=UPI000C69BBF7|nr:GNAT family N-acetyltransferase [Halobacteriovorax sp. JY17]PIK14514.1 MAG: hypothetical protein CES88_09215 [Halobacteriovorax sp. JY17]
MTKFIQSTLAQFPDFFEETLMLIEREFKYPTHHKFLTDFYPLMGPLNHEHCHILIDDNKVIGHIAVKERILSFKNTSTRVALIGAIALDEKYQQQGNFTPFFQKVIEIYSAENSLLLLWSDLKPLYNRFNFFEAGGVIQTGKKKLLNENLPNGWAIHNFKDLNVKEFEEIKTLYKDQELLTLERSEGDWDQIKEISSASLYIKRKNQNIVSYFVKDKGNDLNGIIHEFVTKNASYVEAIDDFIDYQLWLPESFNKVFNKKDIFFGAFLRISNFKLLSIFLSDLTKNQLSISKLEGDKITVKYKEAEFDFKVEEFLTGIFGPNPIEEFSEIMPNFYIAGLDSI